MNTLSIKEQTAIYKEACSDTFQEVFTTIQAANFLSVSKQTLNTWRLPDPKHKGGPVFFRIGRLVRYRRSALLDFLEAQSNLTNP